MQKNVVTDERLSSYRSFFDREWAHRMNRIVDGTPLDPLIFDLTLSWKGIAANNHFPRLMIELVENFWKGVQNPNAGTTAKIVEGVGIRLNQELANDLYPKQLERLKQGIDGMARDTRTLLPQARNAFDGQKMWDNFRSNTEFTLAVWNAQRMIFGGLYYATSIFSSGLTRRPPRRPGIGFTRTLSAGI